MQSVPYDSATVSNYLRDNPGDVIGVFEQAATGFFAVASGPVLEAGMFLWGGLATIGVVQRGAAYALGGHMDASGLMRYLLTVAFVLGLLTFWQQAYTNLLRFSIDLFRLDDEPWVTLQDVYRMAISETEFEERLQAAGRRIPAAALLLTDAEWEAIDRWFRNDWMKLDSKLQTSIVEGVSSFLSLFDMPSVAKAFCPPPGAGSSTRRNLPPLQELVESGGVLALNMPAGANPALSRAVGVMLKQSWLQALLRRPKAMADPDNAGVYWRPAVFLCDEYQSFATVGESDPAGDERSFALSRQSWVVQVVATQSISSLSGGSVEAVRPDGGAQAQLFVQRVGGPGRDLAADGQARRLTRFAERLEELLVAAGGALQGAGLRRAGQRAGDRDSLRRGAHATGDEGLPQAAPAALRGTQGDGRQASGDHSRPGARGAAAQARPAGRGRSARGRGLGPAAGAEHGARRGDQHHPRQYGRGRLDEAGDLCADAIGLGGGAVAGLGFDRGCGDRPDHSRGALAGRAGGHRGPARAKVRPGEGDVGNRKGLAPADRVRLETRHEFVPTRPLRSGRPDRSGADQDGRRGEGQGVIQRFWSAEAAAGPRCQSFLRALNAQGWDVYCTANPLKAGAWRRNKEDVLTQDERCGQTSAAGCC